VKLRRHIVQPEYLRCSEVSSDGPKNRLGPGTVANDDIPPFAAKQLAQPAAGLADSPRPAGSDFTEQMGSCANISESAAQSCFEADGEPGVHVGDVSAFPSEGNQHLLDAAEEVTRGNVQYLHKVDRDVRRVAKIMPISAPFLQRTIPGFPRTEASPQTESLKPAGSGTVRRSWIGGNAS
jgi:hypothetical protein